MLVESDGVWSLVVEAILDHLLADRPWVSERVVHYIIAASY